MIEVSKIMISDMKKYNLLNFNSCPLDAESVNTASTLLGALRCICFIRQGI